MRYGCSATVAAEAIPTKKKIETELGAGRSEAQWPRGHSRAGGGGVLWVGSVREGRAPRAGLTSVRSTSEHVRRA